MQTNKKTNPAEEAFDMAKSINKISRTGFLYGKLNAIKDLQISLLEQEKLITEELESEEKNKWVK